MNSTLFFFLCRVLSVCMAPLYLIWMAHTFHTVSTECPSYKQLFVRVNPHQTSAQGHSDTPHDHMSFFDAVAAGWMDISRKSWDSGNYTLMKKSLGILSVISASIILVSYPKSPEMLQCGPLLSCLIFLKLYTYTRIYFWAIILL